MLLARDRHFAIDACAITSWRDADTVSAVFYDSLSALFPQGERFFIDSVRYYRDRVDGQFAGDVRQFIAQEAIHTREHIAFNAQVTSAGYDVTPLEARTRRELDRIRRKTPLAQLATTVALEHFTAVLAHCLVTDPAHLRAAPDEVRRLWMWHAAEEIEHKSVAFDTLLAATAGWPGYKFWAFRCAVFLETMGRLLRVAAPNFLDLRRQHGPGRLPLRKLPGFFLHRPGLLRHMAPELLTFFVPGFHPGRRNEASLVAAALAY